MNAQTMALAAHLQRHFPETVNIHHMEIGMIEQVSCSCGQAAFSTDDDREGWAAHVAQEWSG